MTEPKRDPIGWRESMLTRLLHRTFALTRAMTLGVRAACFDEAGRLFLVRHSYVPGWHMPGGGVERGETGLAAIEKEMREEGNLVLGDRPALFQVYFNTRGSNRDHVLLYLCRDVTQTAPRLADREIVESGFFPLDALPEETTPATLRRLAELRGEAEPDPYW